MCRILWLSQFSGCVQSDWTLWFKPPTKDINVTAALALMSIVLIELAGIRKKGGKGLGEEFCRAHCHRGADQCAGDIHQTAVAVHAVVW